MTFRPAKTSSLRALSYAWQFGYTIAVPLLVFGIAGRFLDKYFGTGPWLFLAGVLVSIVISTVGLLLKASSIMRDAAGENDPKRSNQQKAS